MILKKIWDYFKEKLKSKKMYIGLKSEDITLNYFLLDDLIDNLYEIFNNNSDIEFNKNNGYNYLCIKNLFSYFHY